MSGINDSIRMLAGLPGDHRILFFLLVAACSGLLLLTLLPNGRKFGRGRAKFRRNQKQRAFHERMKLKANERLVTLANSDSFPAQMGILRNSHPFVFEEMILSALERRGYLIKRNKAYTGDGGIDGKVLINKKWVLLQAKRYRSHIRKQDVIDFAVLCDTKGINGIFIHTGVTGSGAREESRNRRLKIISGEKLIVLLAGSKG